MLFEKILGHQLCVGCGLCASLSSKINIRISEEGFFRPERTSMLSKEENQVISSICPGYSADKRYNKSSHKNSTWGAYNDLTIAYSSQNEIRHRGSSGGVITSLAEFMMKKRKASAIIQVGADNGLLYNVRKINHTVKDVISCAGSRYSPSAPLIDIINILDSEESVVFIGKPCDVTALRNLLHFKPHLKQKVSLIVSFFCAGIPSIHGTVNILDDAKIDKRNLEELHYRGAGWPGYFIARDKSGAEVKLSYADSWGNVLNKHLQFRCKICDDGVGENADIVCGDAWNLAENGYPVFDESQGRSLVVLRSDLGEEIYNEAVHDKSVIEVRKLEFGDYLRQIQRYQYDRKRSIIFRILAIKLFFRLIPKYNYPLLVREGLKSNPISMMKNFFGMVRRLALR